MSSFENAANLACFMLRMTGWVLHALPIVTGRPLEVVKENVPKNLFDLRKAYIFWVFITFSKAHQTLHPAQYTQNAYTWSNYVLIK